MHELEDRLYCAIRSLEELLSQNDEMYRRSDTERLRGKIEGLKLALSYLDENAREARKTPKHEKHDWKVFRELGICLCVSQPRCTWYRHPYGMFDDCGEHDA